jgi:hypothetical protein
MTTATTTRAPGKLDSIATQMYATVNHPGEWTRYKLANGLDIILHRVDDQRWRLAMAREDTYPSDVEVKVVRERFDVPPAADEARSEKQHRHPKTGRVIKYRRVELTWKEL